MQILYFAWIFDKLSLNVPMSIKELNRVRIIGRLELISSKYEEFERFYQMKGFPKKISISSKASFTFVTSSKSDLLSNICKGDFTLGGISALR